MSDPEVLRYRAPRARIAVAYSSKDRLELTRRSVTPLINDPDIDLYWFDGSATEAGQLLPFALCEASAAICELHRNVVGGPDCAILYALGALRAQAYDFVILVENDVLLADGWLAALRASAESAALRGFRVGGATVRVFAERVLSVNDTYCLMMNSGAGCIALVPAAIDIVLTNYRTLNGAEFIRHFQSLTGVDVSATVEFTPDCRLSVDFIFDVLLYLHGYVVTAPVISFATMIDDERRRTVTDVTSPRHHLPQTRGLITRPDQLRTTPFPFFRFQKSPLSDRSLIGCHQLLVSVNMAEATARMRAQGTWRRKWVQGLGPFALAGIGEIRVELYGPKTGLLLYAAGAPVQLLLTKADGSMPRAFTLQANTLADVVLSDDDETGRSSAVLSISAGPAHLLGLTAHASVLSEYANHHATVEHLPA
jgi:hypothetical protein